MAIIAKFIDKRNQSIDITNVLNEWFNGFKLYLKEIVQLAKPFLFLVFLISAGSSGYILIENWNTLDSVFMTVITITTVGFGEVHKLSRDGKIFTMVLIIGGVFFYAITIDSLLKVFIGRRFKSFIEEARMIDAVKKLKNHFIICGGGRMAYAIAQEFVRAEMPFVILENSPDSVILQLKKAGKLDWLILERDALSEESLAEARIEHAKGLAAVLPSDSDNLFVVLSARKMNPEMRIETRIAKESTRDKMIQAGANKVVSPFSIGGLQMARSFIDPEVDDFLEVVFDKANYEFELKTHTIVPGDVNLNKKIKDTDYRKKGYIAIGVRLSDGEMVFSPKPDFLIKLGMEILLLGSGKEKPLQ